MAHIHPLAKLYWDNNLFYDWVNFNRKHQVNIFISSVIICSSCSIYITYNNEKKCKNKLDLISLRNMSISAIFGMLFGDILASCSYFSIPVAVISGGIILLNNTFLK